MDMKKLLVIIFVAMTCNLIMAQSLMLKGSEFSVKLNEGDMTASIVDEDFKVDDARYPMYYGTRKFKDMESAAVRTVVIPSEYVDEDGRKYTITSIGRCAFSGYSNVDQFVIPGTVTSIGDYAFFRTSVSSIEIPASVTQVGNRVFGRCPKLRNLTLPLGMELAYDVYAESKNVTVKYQLDETLAGAVANRKSTPAQLAYAAVSDVEEDIPIATTKNETTFAVVIANEHYKKVAQVPCAHNDGRTFRRYCENTLGIPAENIHYIEDATLGTMTAELNWAARVASAYEGEAKLIIYYAGHGIPNEKDGAGYLLPVDVAGNDVSAAYSLANLYSALAELNVRDVTLFMDACFSGSLRGEGMLASARGVAIKAKAEAPKGKMVVFTAAQGDETAWPYAEKGHGLFTYYLLKKLKETKGDVDYGTLESYIRKEVMRKAAVVNNKSQTPTVSYSPQMSDSWSNLKLK